ncbi:HEPN domain-containing protein [Ponticaulis profundi]|uniref:HEPN domain-containing protein n=1 Tax=Ponticaulis profundi TaxID=2665222 RepID=A0ABW1SBY8_9PROT
MANEKQVDTFERTEFSGSLSDGNESYDVVLIARAGADYRLAIEPTQVSKECYLSFSKYCGEPGGVSAWLSFSGTSLDGRKLDSEHLDIVGSNHSSSGFTFALSASKATITFPQDNEKAAQQNFRVQWCLRGFKSFRPCPVKTTLGTLEVQGDHRRINPDEVSGWISLKSNDSEPNQEWFERADKLLDFVWQGLQFGHGGRLQVPIIQLYQPGQTIVEFYSGTGTAAHLASIHFLNQSDYIKALCERFENEQPFSEAVWQAVGWLNSDTTIDEVRFLTLMTAIETILDNLVPEKQSTVIPKSEFKSIKKDLNEVIRNSELAVEEQEIFIRKISMFNRSTLSEKLNAIIQKYGLPADAFSEATTKMLNEQRNAITHTGEADPRIDLWDCILKAREIVAQVVLSEIGYTGHFESYANGYQMRSLKE